MEQTRGFEIRTKIRKLLAISNSHSGNQYEQDNALRIANKLMIEAGIAETEIDLTAISPDIELGEKICGDESTEIKAGESWKGVIAIGVARFTDTIVQQRKIGHRKEVIIFQGEINDISLAASIYIQLVQNVTAASKTSGFKARCDINSFLYGAAVALQNRLKELVKERLKAFEEAMATGSQALVIVNDKNTRVQERFGSMNTHTKSHKTNYANANGRAYGESMNIPINRSIKQAYTAITHKP